MVYLFALSQGILEFGWVIAAIKAELPVWAALCFLLAYQLGGICGYPMFLGRRLTCIAAGAAAVFAATAGCFDTMSVTSMLLQGCAVFLLSAGIRSVVLHIRCSMAVVPCYHGLGLALSPLAAYFPTALLLGISVAVMVGAFFVPDKKPRFKRKWIYYRYRLLVSGEYFCHTLWKYIAFAAAVVMLGDYAAAILCLVFVARMIGGPLMMCLSRSILTIYMTSRTWFAICVGACCFFKSELPLLACWMYSALGEGAAFSRKAICDRMKLYNLRSECICDSTGSISGAAAAVLITFFLKDNALDVAAASCSIISFLSVFLLMSILGKYVRKHSKAIAIQILEFLAK